MDNKYVCSPSSKGGFSVGVNTAGRMQSNAGVFPSSSSALTNESLPSLAGNCSNDGGSDSLYPDSVSATKYDLRVMQKHLKNSDEVEALKQEKGQLRTVNKIGQLSESIISPIEVHNNDLQKLPPRRPPTDEVNLKARLQKESGQSSNQSVSKTTTRKYWTASESDARIHI